MTVLCLLDARLPLFLFAVVKLPSVYSYACIRAYHSKIDAAHYAFVGEMRKTMGFLSKLLTFGEGKQLKRYQSLVDKIGSLEPLSLIHI